MSGQTTSGHQAADRIVSMTFTEARAIAGALGDVIRMRLADYTPVVNGNQAVILAYTLRMYDSYQLLASQSGLDPRPLKEKIDREVQAAEDAGFWVDRSIAGT